jgi:hypothetical protein
MTVYDCPDISIRNHGSVVVLTGVTPEGRAWLTDNIDPDAMRWGNGFAVEPRYVGPILDGAADAGLEIRW